MPVLSMTKFLKFRLDELVSIHEKLGEGAAGEVFRVTIKRGTDVFGEGAEAALKIYKPEILQYDNQLVRIERERQTGESLSHPNLIKIFASGSINFGGSRKPCLLMELASGLTLSKWVEKNAPILPSKIRHIFLQMIYTVRYLHSRQILHRDLKPDNIIMGDNDQIKIMDFGVCKPFSEATITGSDQFLGSIRYAAPEYLLDLEATESSDSYSLGAILFFLIYGKNIFYEEKLFSRLIRIVEKENPTFSTPKCKPTKDLCIFLEISRRLLSKNVENRPILKDLDVEIGLGTDGKLWQHYIEPLAKYRLASFFPQYPPVREGLFPEKDPKFHINTLLSFLPDEMYQEFVHNLSPEQWIKIWIGQTKRVVNEASYLNKFVSTIDLNLDENQWKEAFINKKTEVDRIAFLRTLLCIAASDPQHNDSVSRFIELASGITDSPNVQEFCHFAQMELAGIYDIQTIS